MSISIFHVQVILLIILFSYTAGQVPEISCVPEQFRSVDGNCNNVKHPTWGKSLEPYRRFLPPNYADGVSLPRVGAGGTPLPNARVVSLAIAQDVKRDNPQMTTMFSIWGLLITMETTRREDGKGSAGADLKCCEESKSDPGCVPIALPVNDPFYARLGIKCMPLVRTAAIQDSRSFFREQINNVESFISGSTIYGSTINDASQLRTFKDGKLRTSQPLNPTMSLPAENSNKCGVVNCFKSGDRRINLTPEAASLNILVLRHHNRLADELKIINPSWDDERIYQETRRIIGALLQLVTYRDFLPLLIGLNNVKGFELELVSNGYYDGYNANINPTVANVFGAAAFRFGHSALIQSYNRIGSNKQPLPSPNLAHTILNPEELYQNKLDSIVRGLLQQKMGEVDQYFTKEVTEHLFETGDQPGTGADLFSINLQRGREHGLAGYNEWREFCRLERATTFEQLNQFIPVEVVTTLKRLYTSVDDIDLYAAGVTEYHVEGGAVGPTFACIIGNQFRNLRRGDKFWFENGNFTGAFTLDQLNDITKMSVADIICANGETIEDVPENAFLTGGKTAVNCAKFKQNLLNPHIWQDESVRTSEAVTPKTSTTATKANNY